MEKAQSRVTPAHSPVINVRRQPRQPPWVSFLPTSSYAKFCQHLGRQPRRSVAYQMPPKIARGRSKTQSPPVSVSYMCRHNLRGRCDCSHFHGESKRGDDSDSSGLTSSIPHQWSDLLNPDLPPIQFDAVLTGVLRSTMEMEKIQGLDEQELQSVIDVLGQVKTLLIQRSWFSIH